MKFIFLISVSVFLVTCHPPKCFLDISPGTSRNCQYSPSIRYHFDPYQMQCHAFKYNGCGGNMNNYKTPGECVESCHVDPKAYIQCPLGTPPIFDSKDNNQCPLRDTDTGEGCESDEAICMNFYTMALCCNRTVEVGLQADLTATCSSGKARWQIDGTTVLAKSCSDVTCPSGYKCTKGNFFYHCCKN